MSRGLFVSSSPGKVTSLVVLTSISSSPFPFRSSFVRLSPPSVTSTSRSLHCCSSRQHETVDITSYREAFAKRMAMAGLLPHHRIAIGVSGGPDSMALCLLAANWKRTVSTAHGCGSGFIDGLLGIIVDHGLRAESEEEAAIVSRRVRDIGIKCEITHCQWPGGKPKKGHLQEAARDKRYQIFQSICTHEQIGALLVAHHADDQAELFILRLSRNSGVLGLAGMAFASQLYSRVSDITDVASDNNGILLVRPLLEFTKDDMYKICASYNQEFVEDPTNHSQMFTRNRIRMALKNLSSPTFNSHLEAVISACRKTRLYVDQTCCHLIDQSVTIMTHGYAVVDLEILNPSNVEDICLSKFVSLVLKFISQRHRPVRGSALKLLLEYLRTYPCKTSCTAAGCYLCPTPGTKGRKLLVCCSVESSSNLQLLHLLPSEGHSYTLPSELSEIIAGSKSNLDRLAIDASNVHFLGVAPSESILAEAKRLNLLNESTYTTILTMQQDETESFRSNSDKFLDTEVSAELACMDTANVIHPGDVCYFMNRFLIKWEKFQNGTNQGCFCLDGQYKIAKVRNMVDADWLYLAKLSQSVNEGTSNLSRGFVAGKVELRPKKRNECSEAAESALELLKSIPVAVRRSLPVLVNLQGELLSVPSVGFRICPCLTVSANFRPRVPLDGGHSSFL